MNESNVGDNNSVPIEQVEELVKQEIHQLIEVKSDDENPGLEDIWLCGQPIGKIIESTREEVREMETSTSNPHTQEGEEGATESENNGMLPIERLAEAEDREDATMGHVTASVDRATTLFSNFTEWASKTPKGMIIKDGLKNLLSTATGERLSWRQVYRAMDKLEEWSKGRITHEVHRKHGHLLRMDGQVSSVTTG